MNHRHLAVRLSVCALLALVSGRAAAQSADPAATPTAAPASDAPAASTGAVTPVAAPAPVPAPSAEEAEGDPWAGTAPWIRVDTDALGTQFWFGATHDFGSFSLASDIYVTGAFAELDVGPALTFGDLALTPMVGIGFDFAAGDAASLIAPQLFSIYRNDSLHFESWIQLFFNSVFSDGVQDIFYTRNFLLVELTDTLLVGPQVELTAGINEEEPSGESPGFDSGLISLPIGGAVSVGYGEHTTLLLFLGYETQDGLGDVAGRFTWIRTF